MQLLSLSMNIVDQIFFVQHSILHKHSREFDIFYVKGKQKYLKTDGVWVWIVDTRMSWHLALERL